MAFLLLGFFKVLDTVRFLSKFAWLKYMLLCDFDHCQLILIIFSQFLKIAPKHQIICQIYFSDFIGHSPLKLTVSGLSSDRGMYKVTLSDEQSQSGGDATVNQIGSGPSVNRTLVELGYAEAVAGSPLDVELQVERTINDPDQVDQLGEL